MATNANAQIPVYDFYTNSIVQKVYTPIDGIDTVIDPNNFVTPLSHYLNSPQTDDDNGVAFDIPLPFTFNYNSQDYTTINICVNGFVNFTTMPLDTRNPNTLFSQNEPNSTLAPFFGDHFLRPDTTQGFVPSTISYAILPDNTQGAPAGSLVFVVQWKNLNVNYLTAPSPKQSVATFQLRIYQTGDIEFHYGPLSTGNVQTSGCSVGIEDENGLSFMNGLFTTGSDPVDSVRYSTRLSSVWPPSGSPGRVIQFVPYGYFVDHWGDGDANLNQNSPRNPGGPSQQNQFVDVNDVIKILRSVVTNVPLDSVFGREAYHGDVNHNGRFIIVNGQRQYDTTKVTDPSIGHPNDIVFFHATSFDAALIALYIAAKLPDLPWIYDTVPPFGKLPGNGGSVTPAIAFGQTLAGQTDKFITVPIMAQGVGALGADFSLNYDPANVRLISINAVQGSGINVVNNNNTIAIAGVSNFTVPTTVATAKFEIIGSSVGQTISTQNLTVNDNLAKDITVSLSSSANEYVLNSYPNPYNVTDGMNQITYSTSNDGYVSLKVYDVLGNVVRTLVSSEQAHGLHTVLFDGKNDSQREMSAGVYFYRLDADGVSQTKQLTIYRNGN
ncbi:MAG TPA: T9SS type A sorting domain-containing protein, partial [Candidatus Kapabacteria bacterium]|nr:T9SS type A sorting domain-containing protein [Candidatus Kapabacteria bacterium]